jgi:hypothetical protein
VSSLSSKPWWELGYLHLRDPITIFLILKMATGSALGNLTFQKYLEEFTYGSVPESVYLCVKSYPCDMRFELLQACLRIAATSPERSYLVTEECARLVMDILHEDHLVDNIIVAYNEVFTDPK